MGTIPSANGDVANAANYRFCKPWFSARNLEKLAPVATSPLGDGDSRCQLATGGASWRQGWRQSDIKFPTFKQTEAPTQSMMSTNPSLASPQAWLAQQQPNLESFHQNIWNFFWSSLQSQAGAKLECNDAKRVQKSAQSCCSMQLRFKQPVEFVQIYQMQCF